MYNIPHKLGLGGNCAKRQASRDTIGLEPAAVFTQGGSDSEVDVELTESGPLVGCMCRNGVA